MSFAVVTGATIIALPVILGSGGGDATIETVSTTVVETAGEASVDVDLTVEVDRLFDAGADATEMSADALAVNQSAGNNPERLMLSATGEPAEDPSESSASSTTNVPGSTTSSTVKKKATTEAPAAAPKSTETSPSTKAPTTAAPETTAAPTTASPTTTAAPETTAVPTTEEPTTQAPTTEAPSSGEPTAEQWANLRQCESGGNYGAYNAAGPYMGAYQFNQATWDSVARLAGRSDLEGVQPHKASPNDQDALALALWRSRGSQPWPHCGKYLS